MKHLIIALASLLSMSSYGQFGPEQELSSMPEGTAIVSVDLDNDGLKDLVGCWRNLYWFKNLGSGQFSKKLNMHTFDYEDRTNEFKCKDLNADGLPDILRYNTTMHTIGILVNTGGGTFAPQEIVLTTASNDPTEVSLEDFNGDGTVDILAFQNTAMVLYLNAGGLTFTGSPLSFPGDSFLGGAAPADYDNDGDMDLVLTNCTNSPATIDFFTNNGSAAFSPAFSVPIGSSCIGRLLIEDIDQDNDLDLIYNLNAGIYLKKNNGSNTYGAAVSIATVYTGGGDPFSFKLGDLNGDGIKDLVTCYGDSGGGGDWLKLTPGIAGGSFGTATTIVHQPWQQTGFVLDDMDADGKKDIVSLSVVNFVLSWLKNNGSGGFPQQTELSNQGKLARVMKTAVNNDGYDDLFIISLNKIQGNTLYAMYRLGTATGLSDSVIYVSGLYGPSVGEMQSQDLDGDGDQDVVYSFFPNSGNGGVAWLRNDGNGSYTSLLISSTVNSGSRLLDVGDLNGDGLPDLLYGGLTIYWARNNGNGTFTQFAVTASYSNVRSLLIADANHDGMNDIVFGHTMVSYLPRTGPTTFGTQVNVSASALYYEHLFPVDVNNDGATDLLCTTRAAIGLAVQVQVRLNDGAGGFAAFANTALPDYVTNMVLFDVDEDGQQELVMAFNVGNFGFAELVNDAVGPVQVLIGTTTYPIRGICLLNVDGDQHRDLVYDQDVVSVYFRKNELFTCAALELDSLQLESCGPGTVSAVSPQQLQWAVQGQPTQTTSHFSWEASAPGTYELAVTLPAKAGCPAIDTTLPIRIYPRYDSIPLSPLTICAGDTATLFGAPQWLAGVYAHPLQTVHGCDSIEYRQLIVTPRPHIALTGMNAASCAGQPVSGSSETALHWTIAGEMTQFGSTFSWSTANPGTYTLVVSLDGTGVCGTTDSSLTVTVHPRFDSLVVSPVSVCSGGSALIFGVSRSVAGTYSNHLQTIHGCDSVLYQELIVHPGYDSLVVNPVSVCSGGSALIFGVSRSVAGTYSNPLQTIHGCDSVLYQQLIVHPGYDSLVVSPVSVCSGGSALIFGVPRSVAGTYSNHLQTINGCDSVLYQQLIVHPGYDSLVVSPVSVCSGASALIFGVPRSVAGTYSNPLQTVHGCDSILYQQLIVDPLPVVSIAAFAEDTICLKNIILVLPDAVPAGGAYAGTGVVGGTFQPAVAGAGTFGISYTFTDPDGCSNSAVSFITVDECLGIDEQAMAAIRVSPNPTTGLLTVQWTEGSVCSITVTDYSGRAVIHNLNPGGFSQELDLGTFAPGTYFLKAVFSDGSTVLEKVVRI